MLEPVNIHFYKFQQENLSGNMNKLYKRILLVHYHKIYHFYVSIIYIMSLSKMGRKKDQLPIIYNFPHINVMISTTKKKLKGITNIFSMMKIDNELTVRKLVARYLLQLN